MGRQLIVFGVVTALVVFHAAADEAEPSETPNPVQEVSPGVADELESSEVQESIHETQPGEAANEGGISAECIAFHADIDANIGDIMRAGCEPTLGQMSKLMDNPIGNVAMWINQVESTTWGSSRSRPVSPRTGASSTGSFTASRASL
jgi:hypothetical protein